MQTLADQSVPELGGRLSVLARQQQDHVRLDQLLRELDRTEPAAQGPVLRRVARLVFPHAFAEESVLWPVFRRVLPDGPALTLQIETEHQEVNELFGDLDRLPPDHPRRAGTLARLVSVLDDDVRDEEDQLLPRVQDALDRRRLQLLGVAWEAVRRVAPTRPHPAMSRRPPGNALAALPLSLLDRTRDRLDSAAERRTGRSAARRSGPSRRLGVLAARIERADRFRRGEHAATARA